MIAHVAKRQKIGASGLEDVLWALLNAKEFVLQALSSSVVRLQGEARDQRQLGRLRWPVQFPTIRPAPAFAACDLSRRSLLNVGGHGAARADDARLCCAARRRHSNEVARARRPITPRAKSVIFLHQFGGPSHLDMFDMKPDAPEAIRGPHKPIASSAAASRSPSSCRASRRSWTRSRSSGACPTR